MEKFVNSLYELLTLDKPVAATFDEWNEWEKNARENKPLAYFINETVPRFSRNIVNRSLEPFNSVKWWIRYRIFDRYHVINTGLKPNYWDTDTRMFHGMFNLLVDHVEVEMAWMHVVFDDDAAKKYHYPWWSLHRLKRFRCPPAGLAHLDWEISLGDPKLPDTERCESQAKYAKEIKEIYLWWKNVRPNRPDPHDASGWSELCDEHRKNNTSILSNKLNSEEKEKISKAHDELRRIEVLYEQEDEQMLIRLIKIRTGLWT